MNREHIRLLLGEAARLTNHRDYVIIGSLSVLGTVATPPESMVFSIDIDLYAKNDPGRTAEIASKLGLGSDFEQLHGYYADVVSPMLPTLPDGWQERLVRLAFENGTVGWFLDPNHAAISKHVRAEPRDRAHGIAAGTVRTSSRCGTRRAGMCDGRRDLGAFARLAFLMRDQGLYFHPALIARLAVSIGES